MKFNQFNSSSPVARARNVEGIIEVLKEHCLTESDKLADPEAKELFKTTASVLEDLSRTYQHYLTKDQVPWESYEDCIPQKSIDPWD